MKNSTAIILILISIGLFYMFVNPQYSKTKTLRAEAKQYKSVLTQVEALSDTRDSLLAEYRTIPRVEVERLSKILPDNIDTVRLAMDFDTIASKYGISIKNIQVSSEKDNVVSTIETGQSPYQRITLSFSFISSYSNFRNFLQDIEQSLRIIDVRSAAFRSNDSNLYEFQVSIETYWIK